MKYEFTDDTMNYDGHIVHQIRRLSDGKLGGWVESEENLSQEGNCWVDDEAMVYGNARVYDNATVSVNAKVYGNAKVYDNAQVYGNAKVYSNAQVYGTAWVFGNARVHGNAAVWGDAKVYDNAYVSDNAKIYDNAHIYHKAQVYGDAQVYGNAWVFDSAEIYGNAQVYDNAEVDYDVKNKTISETDNINELAKYFIYKIDESNKLEVQTEYESIDEFFSEPIVNDVKLDTIIICSVDTKIPLVKLEKSENNDKLNFKFIVDITLENSERFLIKAFIENQEQLNTLITQTIESLKNYPQFSKYAEDLENCIS